jgi:drug/metabolite transporter (DMT)-like permease
VILQKNWLLGIAAGLVTALIGSSWQIVSRSAALTPLGPVELALLRYAIPAVLLLPLLFRVGLMPKSVPRRVLLMLVCGGGLPFGLLVFAGTRFAPAAHMGVMIAATGPLITATLLWLIDRKTVSVSGAVGLALIALGVALLGARSLATQGNTWVGDVFFLLAALVWSGYGIAFRKTALTPWQGAAIVNTWSAILLLPIVLIVLIAGDGLGFAKVSEAALALQLVWQGILAGVFGLVTYTFAVRQLGASGAAAFGALVPVLATLGGWAFLSEAITPLIATASILAMIGVALAVGLFETGKR